MGGFCIGRKAVLLIDEIDKADIEFPNDLLQEIDRMEFYVYETKETVKAVHRPIVIITSNNEKELPDAFLRRCFFHYISFPDRETMQEIVKVHHPKIKQKLVKEALDIFFDVRKVPGLKKKPSTSELVDWLKLLMSDDLPDEILKNRDATKAIPPLYGALIKMNKMFNYLKDLHLWQGENLEINNNAFKLIWHTKKYRSSLHLKGISRFVGWIRKTVSFC